MSIINQNRLRLYFSILPLKQGIGFYYKHFRKKDFNLLSTLPRSGSHVFQAIMNLCYLEKLGLPSEVHFIKEIPYAEIHTNLAAPADFRSFKNHDACYYHTHGGPGEVPIPISKNQNIFCLYRGALGYFESFLKLLNGYSLVQQYSKLDNADLLIGDSNIRLDFKTYKIIEKKLSLVDRYVSYATSTISFLEKNNSSTNFLCHYTDDPKKTNYNIIVKKISDLFGLDFADNQINKACNLLSIKNIQENKPKEFDFFKKEKITLDEDVVEDIGKSTAGFENAIKELSNC